MKQTHIRFRRYKMSQTMEFLAMVLSGSQTQNYHAYQQIKSFPNPKNSQTKEKNQSHQNMLKTSRKHQVKSLSYRPLHIGIMSVPVCSKAFSWVFNIVICQSRMLGQIIFHSDSKQLCIYGQNQHGFCREVSKTFFLLQAILIIYRSRKL